MQYLLHCVYRVDEILLRLLAALTLILRHICIAAYSVGVCQWRRRLSSLLVLSSIVVLAKLESSTVVRDG